MSIVIVGVTTKYVIAMSDGRISSQTHEPVCENFNKLYRINQYVCIGATGHMEFLYDMFAEFNTKYHFKNDLKVNQVFDVIYNITVKH